jgi:lipopolysaccharide/colanic/teichoic acid biosynthesis glycosyltransferase
MYNLFFKRLIDILISLIAIIILSPLLVPIMILLLLTGEHYIFYLQDRIGYKNKKFKIIKFATMLKASPSLGTGSLTVKNDPRILPMGGFLRKTKINELPQLINIFIGDMSIVGPRPQMEFDFLKYSKEVQSMINNVKPGLTGIGSIIFRDEEVFFSKSNMDPHDYDRKFIAPYKGELERWYQNNNTFLTDLRIVFLTAWIILFPRSNLVYRIFKDLPERPEEFDN